MVRVANAHRPYTFGIVTSFDIQPTMMAKQVIDGAPCRNLGACGLRR
jgi:hypothetical protein